MGPALGFRLFLYLRAFSRPVFRQAFVHHSAAADLGLQLCVCRDPHRKDRPGLQERHLLDRMALLAAARCVYIMLAAWLIETFTRSRCTSR